MIPKEQYPGLALQNGGMKFMLRESQVANSNPTAEEIREHGCRYIPPKKVPKASRVEEMKFLTIETSLQILK